MDDEFEGGKEARSEWDSAAAIAELASVDSSSRCYELWDDLRDRDLPLGDRLRLVEAVRAALERLRAPQSAALAPMGRPAMPP